MLKIVNSAAYRRSREITSVQEALVILGFVQARNVAISGAIAGAYAPDATNALFRIESFWRHSIAVAFRAAELAGRSRRIDVPTAFTAGILHNMGRLAMFYSDAAGLDQLWRKRCAATSRSKRLKPIYSAMITAKLGGCWPKSGDSQPMWLTPFAITMGRRKANTRCVA